MRIYCSLKPACVKNLTGGINLQVSNKYIYYFNYYIY
jgi:hypothetical protein